MESYVEVTWLQCLLLFYTSVLFGSYAVFQPLKDRWILLYAITVATLSVSLWQPYSSLVILFTELLFFLTIFRYARRTFIFAYCFRLLSMLTCFVLYGGSFHNGSWFVPIHAQIIWCWLLYVGLLLFCKSRWRMRLSDAHCRYPLTLYVAQHKLRVVGYLDSGNRLSRNGLPVVFLSSRYLSYFDETGIQLVVMKTIQQKSTLACFPCELQLDGCRRQHALVHLQQDLTLPLGCELLLNMKVMTMG